MGVHDPVTWASESLTRVHARCVRGKAAGTCGTPVPSHTCRLFAVYEHALHTCVRPAGSPTLPACGRSSLQAPLSHVGMQVVQPPRPVQGCHGPAHTSVLPCPAGLVCNRTFDMYACWDDATPNTTARVPCPWYLPWHHHGRVANASAMRAPYMLPGVPGAPAGSVPPHACRGAQDTRVPCSPQCGTDPCCAAAAPTGAGSRSRGGRPGTTTRSAKPPPPSCPCRSVPDASVRPGRRELGCVGVLPARGAGCRVGPPLFRGAGPQGVGGGSRSGHPDPPPPPSTRPGCWSAGASSTPRATRCLWPRCSWRCCRCSPAGGGPDSVPPGAPILPWRHGRRDAGGRG